MNVNIPENKERAGWLEERRGPRLRPPDPPTFECSTSSLVKRSGAVSEASAKGADARELDDACRILKNFQRKKFFPNFPPITTFGELGI